jgi:hypothetical protein
MFRHGRLDVGIRYFSQNIPEVREHRVSKLDSTVAHKRITELGPAFSRETLLGNFR